MRGYLLAVLLLLGLSRQAAASGHGPVFGAATPTLGKGGWQIDQAWFGRPGDAPKSEEQRLRTMVSFGIDENLQVSGSVPIMLVNSIFMPNGRMLSTMSAENEVEGLVSWRFHHRPTGAGSRFESTVSGGVGIPLQEFRPDRMLAAPSLNLSAATGYISRSHYVWVGGGYTYHAEREQDHMGDVVFISGVYGYRPPALRLDYPKPDLRFFVEAIAERTERGLHHGVELVTSGGTSVFVGPTALLLYKAYGLSGGMLFPLYQDTNFGPRERFRFAVNASYFFWRK